MSDILILFINKTVVEIHLICAYPGKKLHVFSFSVWNSTTGIYVSSLDKVQQQAWDIHVQIVGLLSPTRCKWSILFSKSYLSIVCMDHGHEFCIYWAAHKRTHFFFLGWPVRELHFVFPSPFNVCELFCGIVLFCIRFHVHIGESQLKCLEWLQHVFIHYMPAWKAQNWRSINSVCRHRRVPRCRGAGRPPPSPIISCSAFFAMLPLADLRCFNHAGCRSHRRWLIGKYNAVSSMGYFTASY